MHFEKATRQDAAEILSLYRACVGQEGCLWDEEYPDMRCIEADLKARMLYVLRRGGRIVACVSCGEEEEHAQMRFWSAAKRPCSVSRVASHPDFRGCGYASIALRLALADCKAQGFDCARLLVSPGNAAALGLYAHLGFTGVGKTTAYGFDWLMMERNLGVRV